MSGYRILKEQYITNDDDHKTGVPRTVPLENLKESIILELAFPIEKEGKETNEIEIHPPKTLDVKNLISQGQNQNLEMFVIKSLRHWTPTDLDSLEPYDYLRVQRAVMLFL